MQMALVVVPAQSCRHAQSTKANVNPKTQVPTANLGHPPLDYSSPRHTAVILSLPSL
jgi:hypothetical protein